jgi:hypothetical protein
MFYDSLLYAIVLVFIVGLLFFMRPIKKIETVYTTSEKNTRFEPTYYLIYDRSTELVCNRLIRVMPFNWVIWAINGDIYIIETTGAAICPSGTTPAIQVLSDIYSMSTACITVLFQSILNLYPGKPHKIFYDIEKSAVPYKFTILDALNDLFEKYLTISFDKEEDLTNRLHFINANSDSTGDVLLGHENLAATKYTIKNRYEHLKPQYHQRLLKKITRQALVSDPLN